MFTTIYNYELKHWIKQPSIYIYASLLFLLAAGMMAGYAGIFDEASTSSNPKLADSAVSIHHIFSLFNELTLFLLPVIIGTTLHRDFSSNTHSILYSYPFLKPDYWLGKFLSGSTLVVIITSFIAVGIIVGMSLPGVNHDLVGAYSFWVFIHEYLVYTIPNMLAYGAIVFVVVSTTRNIYSGFITIFVIIAVQQMLGRIFVSMDNKILFALFDPFGYTATKYYTHLWTVTEQNTLTLPLKGLIVYNRLLWLSISGGIFLWAYKQFSFSQTAASFTLRKRDAVTIVKNNFGSILKISLPKVTYKFTFIDQLKATWRLSNAEFKYIIKGGPFMVILIVGFLVVLFTLAQMNPISANKLMPVTWLMLLFPVFFFLMVINLLTFLYAGMLIQRARSAKMNQLVDSSAMSNWVLLTSKVLALVKMQVVLLSLILIAGISVQTYSGYYNYEIGHYLFHLFIVNLVSCVIWACLAVFVQTVITNPYIGLFLLMLFAGGVGELHLIGIDENIFKFNQNPDPNFITSYSDLGGYGAGLIPFLIYKIYWLLGGLLLLCGSLLMWIRGTSTSLKERLSMVATRLSKPVVTISSLLIIAFVSLACVIYQGEHADTMRSDGNSKPSLGIAFAESADKYQPRITSVFVDMQIYPEERNFLATGKYLMVNKSNRAIDTILVNYKADVLTEYTLDSEHAKIYKISDKPCDAVILTHSLLPGDSMTLTFEVKNVPNTPFQHNSPIENNGTFLTSHLFAPGIGYASGNFTMPDPSDSAALQNMYRSPDADFIDFEAIVSTSEDQMAIAPGYLLKEWMENGRKYYHYKSTSQVTNDYVFNSGVYEVAKDIWVNGDDSIALEIYHHPSHTYNLTRMMKGLKAGLEYNSKHFAPYQHKQARIIEFSRALGNYGQSYANTLPLSEMSFVADIDTSKKGSLDKLFGGIAHEIAHQWWGHQAIPAAINGYAMITESMSEYVALKVIEHEYGKDMLRIYTALSMKKYLKNRARESHIENPLIYNHGQDEPHVPYEKGSLALYALSEYLGEDELNSIIRAYLEQIRFKKPPYTTAPEMSDFIKVRVPDSLKYLVTDLFEKVVLYDNSVNHMVIEKLSDGKYETTIDLSISKYISGPGGSKEYSNNGNDANEQTLPLSDYIPVGAFNRDNELYYEKHLFTKRQNKLRILTKEKPTRIVIDPYHLLIDADIEDNSKSW